MAVREQLATGDGQNRFPAALRFFGWRQRNWRGNEVAVERELGLAATTAIRRCPLEKKASTSSAAARGSCRAAQGDQRMTRATGRRRPKAETKVWRWQRNDEEVGDWKRRMGNTKELT